jgi:hypothetical protein
VIREERLRSDRKSSTLMESMRRKDRKAAGLGGGGDNLREVRRRR